MAIDTALSTALTERINQSIASGTEEGVQCVVYQHGRRIVDLAVGKRDDAGTPLRPDDLIFGWSTTKGITATAIHLLAERGALEYDDAIARYWPAFGSNGKSHISLRHLLSHTAGIATTPLQNGYEILFDEDAICAAVADMTPTQVPGQTYQYHELTYGWPLGKVVAAVSGMSFGAFVQKEIAAPLGISDTCVGLPAARLPDVARTSHDGDAAFFAAQTNNPLPDPTIMANHPVIMAACMPAVNMHASARALARVYAALIGDGVDGVRLLPPRRIANATRVQHWTAENDGAGYTSYGLGYNLGGANTLYGATPTAFGHCGYGGSTGFADPDHGLAVAITKTRMNLKTDAGALKRDLVSIVRAHRTN